MAVSGGPNVATDGLVLALDVVNPNSYGGTGTIVNDLSGMGFTGVVRNGPIVYETGSIASLGFNGLNNYIELSSPTNRWTWAPSDIGNSEYSFELWVKSTDGGGWFLSKPWNTSGQYNYRITNTTWEATAATGSVTRTFTALSNGTWQHIVCGITSTQTVVYRNGVVAAALANHTISGSVPSAGNSNTALSIMTLFPYGDGWGGLTGHAISGSLTIARAYNRLLNSEEVYQNYTSIRSRFGV
jgi:hypothetical protein